MTSVPNRKRFHLTKMTLLKKSCVYCAFKKQQTSIPIDFYDAYPFRFSFKGKVKSSRTMSRQNIVFGFAYVSLEPVSR